MPEIRYKRLMQTWETCKTRLFAACSVLLAAAAAANPYEMIGVRNIFNLRASKAEESRPGDVFRPPPEYKLNGIAGFGATKWALISKADPGKAPRHFMLREGQREGPLEVVLVDEFTGLVRIRNEGALVELTFSTNNMPKINLAIRRFVDEHTRAHEMHQIREAERIARERAEAERAQRHRDEAHPDHEILQEKLEP